MNKEVDAIWSIVCSAGRSRWHAGRVSGACRGGCDAVDLLPRRTQTGVDPKGAVGATSPGEPDFFLRAGTIMGL
jgi:hypothetical protein